MHGLYDVMQLEPNPKLARHIQSGAALSPTLRDEHQSRERIGQHEYAFFRAAQNRVLHLGLSTNEETAVRRKKRQERPRQSRVCSDARRSEGQLLNRRRLRG